MTLLSSMLLLVLSAASTPSLATPLPQELTASPNNNNNPPPSQRSLPLPHSPPSHFSTVATNNGNANSPAPAPVLALRNVDVDPRAVQDASAAVDLTPADLAKIALQYIANQTTNGDVGRLEVVDKWVLLCSSIVPFLSFLLTPFVRHGNSIRTKKSSFSRIHIRQLDPASSNLPILNLVSNVNILSSSGTILSAGYPSTPSQNLTLVSSSFPISPIDAVVIAGNALGYSSIDKSKISYSPTTKKVVGAGFVTEDIEVGQGCFLLDSNLGLDRVWDLMVRTSETWHHIFVSASSGNLIGATDFIHHFSDDRSIEKRQSLDKPTVYQVVEFTNNNILDGPGFSSGIFDTYSSPVGWHTLTADGQFTTVGNNADVRVDITAYRPLSKTSFNYTYDVTKDATFSVNASLVNVFYMVNMYHDLFYNYGFTEADGNFQTDNFDPSIGLGNDAIVAKIQNQTDRNSARFAVAGDGKAPTLYLNMYTGTPLRDSAMDNNMVIHELTHGLSSRLVGGSKNADCLNSVESQGLAEGYSDAIAWFVSMKTGMTRATDRPIMTYAVQDPRGIRDFPYSTNLATNGLTYKFANNSNIYIVGQIWAVALYEVYWNMVDVAGYNRELFLNVDTSTAGNIVFLKTLVNSLKMNSCNPTMLIARDAFLQADVAGNNSKFKCVIWKAFAKRGLGYDAKDYVNGFALAPGC
ncbi:Fungalysin/Thermolysin Extracellular metalloproteinase 5 [Phlyctochytrium planicorne]|nr:Fungalysin/Thermolysin Extracellular metalloproteinase 5 [Phlyctochytrium planicorne]